MVHLTELGTFSIGDNVDKVWTLNHREIQEIPSLFHGGLRLLKNVMIVIREGTIFPLDLSVVSCTIPGIKPVRFTGQVYQKDQKFSFVAMNDLNSETAQIVFTKEPL